MWWEAVPAGAIIFGCFVVPEVFSYYYCWWWQGTPFKRIDMSRWDVYNIIRDERITGEKKIRAATRYHFVGLEGIPDEPESTSSSGKKAC